MSDADRCSFALLALAQLNSKRQYRAFRPNGEQVENVTQSQRPETEERKK